MGGWKGLYRYVGVVVGGWVWGVWRCVVVCGCVWVDGGVDEWVWVGVCMCACESVCGGSVGGVLFYILGMRIILCNLYIGWDQSEKFVKIYISSLPGLDTLKQENVHTTFTDRCGK